MTSNTLRHCLLNDNVASDMSQYDVVRHVLSSFVYIPYNSVITSFRQTFISHSFKCNSSYARFTLSYLSHPTDLTASERYGTSSHNLYIRYRRSNAIVCMYDVVHELDSIDIHYHFHLLCICKQWDIIHYTSSICIYSARR